MIRAGFLTVDDVQRPTSAGCERVQGAQRINTNTEVRHRQQQQQAAGSQRNPAEIDETARGEYGYRQRAGKFDRHRDSQRHAVERQVVEQVHYTQRDAIDDERAPGG